eukprot:553946-Amphidinium_carterae.1
MTIAFCTSLDCIQQDDTCTLPTQCVVASNPNIQNAKYQLQRISRGGSRSRVQRRVQRPPRALSPAHPHGQSWQRSPRAKGLGSDRFVMQAHPHAA